MLFERLKQHEPSFTLEDMVWFQRLFCLFTKKHNVAFVCVRKQSESTCSSSSEICWINPGCLLDQHNKALLSLVRRKGKILSETNYPFTFALVFNWIRCGSLTCESCTLSPDRESDHLSRIIKWLISFWLVLHILYLYFWSYWRCSLWKDKSLRGEGATLGLGSCVVDCHCSEGKTDLT